MGLLSSLTGKLTARAKSPSGTKTDENSKYRAVQVNVPDEECCQAAREIQGKRFLSDEVPLLPLKECDSSDCRCTYELFGDRRTDARRVSDLAFDIAGQYHNPNLRNNSATGRRVKDRSTVI